MKADLDKERAVMAKEREMQDLLRQADRESAKLQAKIEQLSSVKNPAKKNSDTKRSLPWKNH